MEIGGDVEIGQAGVNQFLDGVAISLNRAGDARVQRPPVVGQTSDAFEEFRADRLFPAIRFRNRLDLIDLSLTLLKLSLRDLVHPLKKRIGRSVLSQK